MELVNGHCLMSNNFSKFYEKYWGISLDQLSRQPSEMIPGLKVVHSWKMLDQHISIVLDQLLEGLDYSMLELTKVHREKHCVHKDLKLDNVLINQDFQVVLIDFGISEKEHAWNESGCYGIKGNKMFAAPEVFAEGVGIE